MPDITREDCFPDDHPTQNWKTYGGGTDCTMTVRICEVCGDLVRLDYLDRHAASHGGLGTPTASSGDVRLAVEAIGQVVGGFKVLWYDKPFEGWDALLDPDVDCYCEPKGQCYCCDGASVTREQVEALRRIGVKVTDA